MHVRSEQPVVHVPDAGELVIAQRRQCRAGGVTAHLLGIARTGNDRADPRLVDDPAKRELGQRLARIEQRLEFAAKPTSNGTPANVSPTSNASPCRL
jgi:hypothetical protein